MTTKVVSTWFYEQDRHEGGVYPQVKGDPASQEFRDVYRRCIAIFFLSARRSFPEASLRLFLNRPWDEGASVTAKTVAELLRELNVAVEVLPYTFEPPPTWSPEWRNQFFIFDAMAALGRDVDDEAAVLLLDSDIVFTAEASMSGIFEAISRHQALAYYPVEHQGIDQATNGLSRAGMQELWNSLPTGSGTLSHIPLYVGGEFVAVSAQRLAKLNRVVEQVWPHLLRVHAVTGVVFEEAHVLSMLYGSIDGHTEDASSYIRRLWTTPFFRRNVESGDLRLPLWHLPAEKRYGYERVYAKLAQSHSVQHAFIAKSMGIPRTTPGKALRDLTRAGADRFRNLIRTHSAVASHHREVDHLVWCTPTRMPYNDDLFDRTGHSVWRRLTVCYALSSHRSYPFDDFSQTGQNALVGWRAFPRLVHLAVNEPRATWVLTGWNLPMFNCLVLLLVGLRRRFFVFTDTPIIEGRDSRWYIRKIRSHVLSIWLRNADGVMVTGEIGVSLMRQLADRHGVTVSNLPCPLDEKRFDLATKPAATEVLELIFVGRLSISDKRADVALRALAQVERIMPGRAHLTLAGEGPDRDALVALSSSLGIQRQTSFVGWQSQAELRRLYSKSHVYLHTADFEPYGVTLVEALYSGLYCVASEGVTAAQELITPGVNGSLIAAGDYRAAADEILSARESLVSGAVSAGDIRAASLAWDMEKYLRQLQSILRGEA